MFALGTLPTNLYVLLKSFIDNFRLTWLFRGDFRFVSGHRLRKCSRKLLRAVATSPRSLLRFMTSCLWINLPLLPSFSMTSFLTTLYVQSRPFCCHYTRLIHFFVQDIEDPKVLLHFNTLPEAVAPAILATEPKPIADNKVRLNAFLFAFSNCFVEHFHRKPRRRLPQHLR